MNELELLRKRLVPLFIKEFESLEVDEGNCEVFGEWIKGYVNIDSYGTRTIHSDILRCFCQPSLEVIGYALGTRQNPKTAMRLIDYKSAWLIVPVNENEKIELWCGGKYVEKVALNSPFLVKSLSGNQALMSLIEDERSFLAISLGLRKELYLKNLLAGDENNLVLCEETGTVVVPRKNWHVFKKSYIELNKKIKGEALIILRGITHGRLDQNSERVQDFFKKNMEFALVCKETLPKNPLARNVWLSAIGVI